MNSHPLIDKASLLRYARRLIWPSKIFETEHRFFFRLQISTSMHLVQGKDQATIKPLTLSMVLFLVELS